jgi:hypothetical protein
MVSISRARQIAFSANIYKIGKETDNALDNLCNLISALASRDGEFLHAGRIYSYPSGNCCCCRLDSPDSRQAHRLSESS